MSNELAVVPPVTQVAVTFADMARLAEAVAKSGLFGFKTADQALALMAIAQAEGTHPALAARDYHIVQGRPVLKSDAMLARFQAAGGKVRWLELTDQRAQAEFSHPIGGSVTIDWDIERAKRAGLTGKDVWKAYGRQMLRARVISEGVRTVFPGATGGLYTPEEAADMPEAAVTAPARPATGIEALRAKVAELAPPVIDTDTGEVLPAVTLEQFRRALALAQSEDDFATAADLARGLPEADKAEAREAFREAHGEWQARAA